MPELELKREKKKKKRKFVGSYAGLQRELNNEVKEGGLLSEQALGILNKAAKRNSHEISGACDHSAENQTALEEKLFRYLLYKHKYATVSIVYFNRRRDNG